MFRSLPRHPGVQAILCWLIGKYIQLVWKTGRWTFTGDEAPRALTKAGEPYIVAFWHGRLLMTPFALGGDRRNICVVISAHRDGQLIARAVNQFDIVTIAGSTSKGGADAFRRAARFLRGGGSLAITPDGPRGPRMRASNGIVTIARLTGAPILPLSFSTSRRIVLGSWDRFVLPLPFSRGAFVWGPPIAVARDAGPGAQETARRAIEQALTATTHQADTLVGQSIIEPAPEADDGRMTTAMER